MNSNKFRSINTKRTNFKMYKAGRSWIFACATFLTMMGAGSLATTPVSAAEDIKIESKSAVLAVDAPKLNPMTTNDTALTGTSVSGYEIEVTVNGVSVPSTVVNADGTFSVEVGKQPAGTVIEANAFSIDDFSRSEAVSITVTSASVQTAVINSLDDNLTTDSTSVTGIATPNSAITVTANGSEIASGTANASGDFNISIPKQTEGTVLSVTATIGDTTSPAKTVTVKKASTTSTVTKPTLTPAKAGDKTVYGTGTPGNTITLSIDGKSAGTAVVSSGGNWSITVTALTAGQQLSAIASLEGNADSDAATGTVQPSSAAVVTVPTINLATEGETTVSGTGTAGNTVTLTIDGRVVDSVVVGSNNTWSMNVPALVVDAKLSAIASEEGAPNSKPAEATVKPKASEELKLNSIDPVTDVATAVSGKANPVGATVEVRNTADNTKTPLGTAVVQNDGSYSVPIKSQIAGTILYVRVVEGNNYTDDQHVTVSVAEDNLTVNPLTVNDRSVTGTAKPGNLITAASPTTQIGSVAANENGGYTIPIQGKLTRHEVITVTSRNPNTNKVEATYQIIVGNVATELENTLIVTDTVKTVQGITARGASVRILDGNGTLIATGVADADGYFQIKLPTDRGFEIGTKLSLIASEGTVDSPTKVLNLTADLTANLVSSGNIYGVYGQVTPDADTEYNNVYLKNASGDTIGISTINKADGSFIIVLPNSVSAGDWLSMYAQNDKDPNQRSSTSKFIVPRAVIFDSDPDASAITGYALGVANGTEAIVYQRNARGALIEQPLGTGVVDSSGFFTLNMTTKLNANDDYVVVFGLQTDDPVKIPVGKADANNKVNPLAANQGAISGTGTAGHWVTVQNVNNHSLQRIQIPDSGIWEIELSQNTKVNDKFIVSFVTPATVAAKHEGDSATQGINAPDVTNTMLITIPYAG